MLWWWVDIDWLPGPQPIALSLSVLNRTDRESKAQKLVGWDTGSLIMKKKTAHRSKAETTSLGQMDVHPLLGKQGLNVMVVWEDKCHYYKCPCILFLSFRFHCWTWHRKVWNVPLVSWGQLSWLCPIPTLAHLQPTGLWGKEWFGQKALMLCRNCSAIAKTLVCYHHCSSHKCKA